MASTSTSTSTKLQLPAAMRGRFSIEWMAQSSQTRIQTQTLGSGPGPGPAACGTHSESLPGFYCRQKTEQEGSESLSGSFQLQGPEAGFSSGTEEETSGYESEGGHSLSPSSSSSSSSAAASTSPASPPSGRRPRTAFTSEQISSLEKAFKKNAYLGQQDKADLCRKLSLSDKQVRNWFQNRRMKLKRTVQDALAHACQVNSHFVHYGELQAYRPGPYPRYPPAGAPAPEAPAAAASYVHPHPHALQYSSALPLDSFYQYGGLQGVVLPSASSALRGSYPPYPQYY